jgi:signal-transduction protein with cAMP-binding, CBS, and nucleotidyltransferase domain
MKVADISLRPAVTTLPGSTLADVAATMAQAGVGCVVIVEHGRLLGIVTDRDLVVRGVARGLPVDSRVDAVMSMGVIAIDHDADIRAAIASFGHHAVRRMPVVDGHRVVGLVSLDDLMVTLAGAFDACARGLTAQLLFPHAADEALAPVAV